MNIPLSLLFFGALVIILILFVISYVLTKNQDRIVKSESQDQNPIDVGAENLYSLLGDNTKRPK